MDNLKHMIDTYSNLDYNCFEVIDCLKLCGVYDKLQMFKLFRDGQNLYFDLDVIITGDCNKFLKSSLSHRSIFFFLEPVRALEPQTSS